MSRPLALALATMLCGLALATSPAIAAGPLCTPPDADLGNPQELHFDPKTIATYERGLKAPEVLAVRHALDAAVAGKADHRTAVILSGIPKDVMIDRFDLLDEVRDPRGDYDLLVLFRQNRQNVLQFTVEPPSRSHKSYAINDVRGAKCSLQQQAWLGVRFRELETAAP